jgi:signal transduction histidine kinase
LRTPEGKHFKIAILAGLMTLTLAIHYGWVFQPLFGQYHWFHALHGRFCYIPIVVAAAWFGLRGGLSAAAVISVLLVPFFVRTEMNTHELVGEVVELVFYFFIAALVGALVEREIRARRKQQRAELQVERSQKLSLMGQIAAGVAHEIKNPLTSIKGAADILADDKTSPQDRNEFKDVLQDEVRRIDATVTEFLTYARPRETKLERIDFSEVIRSCVRQVTAQANKDDISLQSRIANDLFVNGDAEKLHQMALNLILNAIQASKAGDTIEVSLDKESPSKVRLQISDTGAGLNEEDMERAFEPFFTTRASGTGLGLAIVRSIVDNHRGDISLKSREGHGTAATVKIPIWSEQE